MAVTAERLKALGYTEPKPRPSKEAVTPDRLRALGFPVAEQPLQEKADPSKMPTEQQLYEQELQKQLQARSGGMMDYLPGPLKDVASAAAGYASDMAGMGLRGAAAVENTARALIPDKLEGAAGFVARTALPGIGHITLPRSEMARKKLDLANQLQQTSEIFDQEVEKARGNGALGWARKMGTGALRSGANMVTGALLGGPYGAVAMGGATEASQKYGELERKGASEAEQLGWATAAGVWESTVGAILNKVLGGNEKLIGDALKGIGPKLWKMPLKEAGKEVLKAQGKAQVDEQITEQGHLAMSYADGTRVYSPDELLGDILRTARDTAMQTAMLTAGAQTTTQLGARAAEKRQGETPFGQTPPPATPTQRPQPSQRANLNPPTTPRPIPREELEAIRAKRAKGYSVSVPEGQELGLTPEQMKNRESRNAAVDDLISQAQEQQNAGTISPNQRVSEEAGQVGQGGQVNRGGDVYQSGQVEGGEKPAGQKSATQEVQVAPKVGDTRKDELGVEQVFRMVDPNTVGFTEPTKDVENSKEVEEYTRLAKEGSVPPPVDIVWNEDSGKPVTTNRRRVMAAQRAGTLVPAWVDKKADENLFPTKPTPPAPVEAQSDIDRAVAAAMAQVEAEEAAPPVKSKGRTKVPKPAKSKGVKPVEQNVEEQRAASNTATLDQKHRLKKPIKGKTDAEIVGYEWASMEEEGMYSDRRVSDWSRAQTSVPTGRSIVHLFWVRTPDGTETLMGVGAAKKALGLTENRLYTIAKNEQASQAASKKRWDAEAKRIEQSGASSVGEASRAWREANNPAKATWGTEAERVAKYDELFNQSTVLEKNGKFIRTTDPDTIRELKDRGFTEPTPKVGRKGAPKKPAPKNVSEVVKAVAAQGEQEKRGAVSEAGSPLGMTEDEFAKASKRVKVVKRYGVGSGRRFAAVEVDGQRVDVVVREEYKGSEETRIPEIRRLVYRKLKEMQASTRQPSPELQAAKAEKDQARKELIRKASKLSSNLPGAVNPELALAAVKYVKAAVKFEIIRFKDLVKDLIRQTSKERALELDEYLQAAWKQQGAKDPRLDKPTSVQALLNKPAKKAKAAPKAEPKAEKAAPKSNWQDSVLSALSGKTKVADAVELPTLWAQVQKANPGLTMEEFKQGLLKLHEDGKIKLEDATGEWATIIDNPLAIRGKDFDMERGYGLKWWVRGVEGAKPTPVESPVKNPVPPPVKEAPKAEEPKKTGRPDLANPATPQQVRDLVDVVDTQRTAEGNPAPITREEIDKAADKLLAEDYEGQRTNLIRQGMSGGQLSDSETAAAKKILNREGLGAIQQGDQQSLTDAMALIEAYRNTGSAQARAFGQRIDPVETPAERRARLITEAILEPPAKQRERRNQARREGNHELADKINKEWADKIKDLKRDLKKVGIDLDNDLKPTQRPAPKPPTTKTDKTIKQERAKKARADFMAAFRRVASAPSMAGVASTELLKPAIELVRAHIDLGIANFKDFIEGLKSDGDFDPEMEPILKEAWDQVEGKAAAPDISQKKAATIVRAVEALKSTAFDKATEYWISGILSAPATQTANIFGNTFHAAWSFTAERLIEATANLALRRPEGAQFGEFKHLLAGVLPGISRGAKNFLMSWDTELPILESQLNRGAASKLDKPNTAIGGKTGRIVRIPLRLLQAVDDFCKSVFVEMESGAQAYRIAKGEGLKGQELQARISELLGDIESPAWDAAYDSALELSFQQEGGKAVRNIKQLMLKARKDFPVLTFLVPFVSTPINIFGTGIKKSPLGTINVGMKMYRNYRDGKHVLNGLPPLVAQQVLAWALVMALMGNDDDDPWITGAEQSLGPGKRELSYRSIPAMSVKIGDTWYSYSRLEPFATAIGLTVDFVNALKSGDTERMVKSPPTTLLGQVQTKTFMSGLGSVVSAVNSEDPVEAAGKWASDFTVSWIPNLVRSLSREADSEYMNRRVWGKGGDWWRMLMKRTGQKTEMLPIQDYPNYDVWGRPAKRSESPVGADWLYRITVPIRNQKDETFVADRLIINWNNAHPDGDGRFPRTPDPYYTKDGETVYMTPEQFADYTRLAGETTRFALEDQRVKLDADNPKEAHVEWIGDVTTKARAAVREQAIKQWEAGSKLEVDSRAVGKQVVDKLLGNMIYQAHREPPDPKSKDYRDKPEALQKAQEAFQADQASFAALKAEVSLDEAERLLAVRYAAEMGTEPIQSDGQWLPSGSAKKNAAFKERRKALRKAYQGK